MKKRQTGFTIIELVMVIVILGILAAFALPRFADLGTSAKESALKGIAGSFKSASGLAHSQSLAQGKAAADPITMEGKAITMKNNYPAALAAGIMEAANFSLGADWTSTTAAGKITITRVGVTTASECSITYTEAGAGGAALVNVSGDGSVAGGATLNCG